MQEEDPQRSPNLKKYKLASDQNNLLKLMLDLMETHFKALNMRNYGRAEASEPTYVCIFGSPSLPALELKYRFRNR